MKLHAATCLQMELKFHGPKRPYIWGYTLKVDANFHVGLKVFFTLYVSLTASFENLKN